MFVVSSQPTINFSIYEKIESLHFEYVMCFAHYIPSRDQGFSTADKS